MVLVQVLECRRSIDCRTVRPEGHTQIHWLESSAVAVGCKSSRGSGGSWSWDVFAIASVTGSHGCIVCGTIVSISTVSRSRVRGATGVLDSTTVAASSVAVFVLVWLVILCSTVFDFSDEACFGCTTMSALCLVHQRAIASHLLTLIGIVGSFATASTVHTRRWHFLLVWQYSCSDTGNNRLMSVGRFTTTAD